MANKRPSKVQVTPSSGNVFADLGFPDPEEELAKAQFLTLIQRAIRRRRLSQSAAAALMGIEQEKLSALLDLRSVGLSSERLIRLLIRLGQDIDITVKAAPRNGARGCIRVHGEWRVQAAARRPALSRLTQRVQAV